MPTYRIMNVAVVVVAFLVVSWYGYHVAMSYIPPSEYEDAYAEPPIVHKGDSLNITYLINRKRYCPTFLHQFILADEDPPRLVWSVVKPGGISLIGSRPTAHEIEQVKYLPVGKYIFRGAGNPKCPEGEFYYFHKDIKFEVVP